MILCAVITQLNGMDGEPVLVFRQSNRISVHSLAMWMRKSLYLQLLCFFQANHIAWLILPRAIESIKWPAYHHSSFPLPLMLLMHPVWRKQRLGTVGRRILCISYRMHNRNGSGAASTIHLSLSISYMISFVFPFMGIIRVLDENWI